MQQVSTQNMVRWMVRLVGLLVIGYNVILFLMVQGDNNFPPGADQPGLLLEVAARSVIVLGYAATFRFERVGGAVMILGAALLSVAIYLWAAALGDYTSPLIGGHCMPVLLAGFLFLTLPQTPEPEIAYEFQTGPAYHRPMTPLPVLREGRSANLRMATSMRLPPNGATSRALSRE